MPLTRPFIIKTIEQLDGEIGANVANTALNELVKTYESGLNLPLTDSQTQIEFVEDLEETIASLRAVHRELKEKLQIAVAG